MNVNSLTRAGIRKITSSTDRVEQDPSESCFRMSNYIHGCVQEVYAVPLVQFVERLIKVMNFTE